MTLTRRQASLLRSKRLAATAIGSCAVLVAGLFPVHANTDLDGDTIRKRVTGKRIYLATPLGGEFPLFYQANGRVDGSGEASGLGRLARPTDSGRWWIANDKLCQRWQTWYDGKTLCFKLTQLTGNQLRWVQDNGDTGIARIGN